MRGRFWQVALTLVIVCPLAAYCLADKPKKKDRRSESWLATKVPRLKVDSGRPLTDKEKLDWAAKRSVMNRHGYVGVKPASNAQACDSVVWNLYGWASTPFLITDINATWSWTCTANGSSNPCEIVAVSVVTDSVQGIPRVYHEDVSLQCGGSSDPTVELGSASLQGEYVVNIDLYPGTWATWTPNTPVLDSYTFFFTLSP